MIPRFKSFAKRVGIGWLYWRLQRLRSSGPTYFANFIFQRLLRINSNCLWSVHYTSRVMHPQKIKVHPSSRTNFAVSGGCYIQASNGIEIGEETIFAPGVKIISANHDLNTLACGVPAPPIRIGAFCWLGANAVILPGVTLGDHVIVGAGSVVTKSFPAHVVIAGVPARVVRQSNSDRVAGVGLQ